MTGKKWASSVIWNMLNAFRNSKQSIIEKVTLATLVYFVMWLVSMKTNHNWITVPCIQKMYSYNLRTQQHIPSIYLCITPCRNNANVILYPTEAGMLTQYNNSWDKDSVLWTKTRFCDKMQQAVSKYATRQPYGKLQRLTLPNDVSRNKLFTSPKCEILLEYLCLISILLKPNL